MRSSGYAVWLVASLVCAAGCRSGEFGGSSPGGAAGMSAFEASADRAETPTTAPETGGPARMFVEKAELGEPAPDFALKDVDGRTYRLSHFKGKAIVLEWFNPRCPYCLEAYQPNGVLRELPAHWMSEGVVWISINSQGPEEPGSSVRENAEFRREHEMRTPLLMDPTGVVGKAYGAKTTPQLFVISERGVLVYRGALDNAPHGVVPVRDVKTNYVDAALKDLRSGRAVTIVETRTYGSAVRYAKP
jgi:peroxiredoxin